MKVLVAFLLISTAFADVRICTPDIRCQPRHEFVNNDTTTEEWNDFVGELVQKTFHDEFSLNCMSDPTQPVWLDPGSDFIWDLRFTIYSERQNRDQKTLNDCYCEHRDCDTVEFRDCMASARKSMTAELSSFWVTQVYNEIIRLLQLC